MKSSVPFAVSVYGMSPGDPQGLVLGPYLFGDEVVVSFFFFHHFVTNDSLIYIKIHVLF